jgi:hypothetical protein
MVQIISVDPVPGGWMVANPFSTTPMFFLSGAKAERKARELGDRLVSVGQAAEVQVHGRNGLILGRLHFGWIPGRDQL